MNGEIMSLEDVAAYMKINKRTAYNLANAQKIPAKKVGGKWFVSRAALEKFLGVPEQKAVQS